MILMYIAIKDLPSGKIIWYKDDILGITGSTIPDKYLNNYCYKCSGNDLDYCMIDQTTSDKEKQRELEDSIFDNIIQYNKLKNEQVINQCK